MDASDNGDQSASSRASSPGQHPNHRHYADNDNASIADSSIMEGPNRSTKPKAPRRSNVNSGAAAQGLQTVGKIRHLKKEDGEPLWRKDIQHDFLRAVFDNDKVVFTNPYMGDKTPKQNFADLYIDTMSRSSKTSKVLRDKLLNDREAAKSMAMVCLLVNVGRMNTTLNFFPEMRAQLRTYHAIPSLQAYQDASAYKQLQDAPRLKSILKGAAEDNAAEPRNLNEAKNASVPRTNPVNLIFLLCQHAQQVAELHFPPEFEFHDLIMKTNITSESRANAFLWLMWFYLESDFTEEGCEENPFGAGVDYETEVANQGVPRLKEMTAEEEAAENIDPQLELDFGREKQAHRAKIIAADAAYMQEHQPKIRTGRSKLLEDSPASAAILPRIRPSKHESDLDSNRSTPPPRALARMGAASTGRRGGASLKYQIFDHSSPAGPSSHIVLDGVVPRKPRPPTAHQLAVEQNRSQRVDHILDRGLRKEHHQARKLRRREGAIIRAKHRLDTMPDPLVDSDGEDYRAVYDKEKNGDTFRGRGLGGLCQLSTEDDDFGEEIASYAAALRRISRRLVRWENSEKKEMVRPIRKKVPMMDSDGDELDTTDPDRDGRDAGRESSEKGKAEINGNADGDVIMEDADDLDDMERALLGMDEGHDKDDDGDEELDDVEKALLGAEDDEDESEE